MPVRKLEDGSSERIALAEDRAAYAATEADAATIREHYDGYEYAERPHMLVPDGWRSLRSTGLGDRELLVVARYGSDACVEVSYRYQGVQPVDHQVRALPPEEAYQVMLDVDEQTRKNGFMVYDERHPRPRP